jgi:hypothetical protein
VPVLVNVADENETHTFPSGSTRALNARRPARSQTPN